MTGDEWVAEYAAAVGVTPPTSDEVDALLEIAGIAAHASERTAAPITTWLAARGGLSPASALKLASSLEKRPLI